MSIKKAKAVINMPNTKCAITTIATDFSFLIKKMELLQSGFASLSATLKTFESIERQFNSLNEENTQIIVNKFSNVFEKNKQ